MRVQHSLSELPHSTKQAIKSKVINVFSCVLNGSATNTSSTKGTISYGVRIVLPYSPYRIISYKYRTNVRVCIGDENKPNMSFKNMPYEAKFCEKNNQDKECIRNM